MGCVCFTGVLNFILISQAVYELSGVSNVENRTHTHTHTHTSGRQLKITFIDVSDYFEYSDTNISEKKISRKHSFLSEEAKININYLYAQVFINILHYYNYYINIIILLLSRVNSYEKDQKHIMYREKFTMK